MHPSSQNQSVKGIYNSNFSLLLFLLHYFLVWSSLCNLWFWYIYRNSIESKLVVLKEDDILRVAKLILPATNLAISKTKEIFSGEPAMTLKVINHINFNGFPHQNHAFDIAVSVITKMSSIIWFQVAPVLILGAEYGHLLTLWRLCALGN